MVETTAETQLVGSEFDGDLFEENKPYLSATSDHKLKGKVNYLVNLHDRRKSKRVFHGLTSTNYFVEEATDDTDLEDIMPSKEGRRVKFRTKRKVERSS